MTLWILIATFAAGTNAASPGFSIPKAIHLLSKNIHAVLPRVLGVCRCKPVIGDENFPKICFPGRSARRMIGHQIHPLEERNPASIHQTWKSPTGQATESYLSAQIRKGSRSPSELEPATPSGPMRGTTPSNVILSWVTQGVKGVRASATNLETTPNDLQLRPKPANFTEFWPAQRTIRPSTALAAATDELPPIFPAASALFSHPRLSPVWPLPKSPSSPQRPRQSRPQS